MDKITGNYLSGYADGEGSFCVSFSPSKRHRFGWEVRPSFSVSQNFDRAEILHLFKKEWNTGTIRPDRSDKTLKFEIRAIESLITTVIPHFQEFPILSAKQKDFENFAQICQMIQSKKHLEPFGFATIVGLAFKMNPSGKRKYQKEHVLKLVR
jgi:hypothetical protein